MIQVGGVAQLGERLPCTQEAIGSNPFTSTIFFIMVAWRQVEPLICSIIYCMPRVVKFVKYLEIFYEFSDLRDRRFVL